MTRRATTRPAQVRPIRLSPEATRTFDDFVAAQAEVRQLRAAEQRLDKAREILSQAFGPAFLGRTADGRLIQRCQQTRQYRPLDAREVTWQEFQEICPWDS